MPKPVQASSYTFRHIIEGGFVYVDKTQYLYELVHRSIGLYFLARPRRFGKSLMITTLEEIFLGNKELFRDLWIYTSDYNWQTYPVIRLDFSQQRVHTAAEVGNVISGFLEDIAQQYNVTLSEGNYQLKFRRLIQTLAQKGRVVLLIDEYDKPIVDNIENIPEAKRIRDTLKDFYGIIKAMDQHLRFVLITGISKFSKVGIFSALNNLDDLTMRPRFATALGITEEELGQYLGEHIAELATKMGLSPSELRAEVRRWYNGFCFVENCPNVYNPFSTLQLLNQQRFANYWFETGTPTFLIKLIKSQQYNIEPFEHLEVPELTFSTYEIESLALVPLLFQTGYLTIKGFRRDQFGEIYTLSYPNYEVKHAFLSYLLSAYDEIEVALSDGHLRRLLYALEAQDLPEFFSVLEVFFANIDYDLHLDYEKYYQTIFYLIFVLLGVRISAEVKTSQGRIDAVIELAKRISLFEFKLNGSADEALQQIKAHAYAQKYRGKGKPLTLIGANFASAQRKITDWKSEQDVSA